MANMGPRSMDDDMGGEAGEETRRGPYGSGPYQNSNNSLEIGGSISENEATSMTAETMAAMGSQVAPDRSQIRQASEQEMRGGNA